jgi:serralysin
VIAIGGHGTTITLGNGVGDRVDARDSQHDTITLGNGDGDTVFGGGSSNITVGNGNDTIHVGFANIVTVGTGQDTFMFDQTRAGAIGAVTINGFDPSKDVIVLQTALVPGQNVPAHDDASGNAVVTVTAGDTITLVGVHSSDLHASDFLFV